MTSKIWEAIKKAMREREGKKFTLIFETIEQRKLFEINLDYVLNSIPSKKVKKK